MSGAAPNALDRLAVVAAKLASPDSLLAVHGTAREVAGGQCRVAGLSALARIGHRVRFEGRHPPVLGEVVAVDEAGARVKLYDSGAAIGVGDRARLVPAEPVAPADSWKGRILDALGQPIDGGGPLETGPRGYHADAAPPPSLARRRIGQPLVSGVRVVDLFCPLVRGQRIGIFAGSGVGKSTLLGMLAAGNGFDCVVVALVGERGREVREFIEGPLAGAQTRAIVVVSTADESAAMRRLAPATATAIAEAFRDRGESVLLVVDSITRYAHAAREVALAAGEAPVARGYAPSVFSDLPRLLERAGPGTEGSGTITAIHSVLVDGDDHNEPVADCVRGTLDGHIVLDRAIADEGRFPAVNVLRSLSRLAPLVWTPEQNELIRRMRRLIARFEETKDVRLLGGYRPGLDAELDQAVDLVPRLFNALAQAPGAPPARDAFREIAEILAGPR